ANAHVELHDGSVQWRHPEDLQVGKVSTIAVLVSWEQTDATASLEGTGRPEIALVKVAGWMRAVLVAKDKDAAEVTPVDAADSVQRLTPGKPATWRWDIRPLKKGTLILHLGVDAFLTDRENATDSQQVFNKEIQVKANYPWQLARFFRGAWQFFAGGIAIQLFIGGWKRFKRPKQEPVIVD